MIYALFCEKCNTDVVVDHPMSEPHPTEHEGCGGKLLRKFSDMANVVYRSGGFYTTDKRLDPNPNDE